MKVIYCIHSLYNPGGMERVMTNKICYLKAHTDWDIQVATTNQHGRPPYFPLPEGVTLTDLDINYTKENDRNPLRKIAGFLRKRRLHRKRLKALLMQERADVVVSLYPSESSFIPALADGSKKVLELHFNRFFRLQYGRHGIVGTLDRWRSALDARIVRRFDRFVVLTEEDRAYWGDVVNMVAIPNAVTMTCDERSDATPHRVIAVGRLDYQKGFDRLVDAWAIVCRDKELADWTLDIYGQGEWHDMLLERIRQAGIEQRITLRGTSTDMEHEYATSSIIAMTSHYEGLPMVLIEAMSHGVPPVAFACKCGPRDIIDDGVNGLLVDEGDTAGMAQALAALMKDEERRRKMSEEALKITEKYNEETIMRQWMELFEQLEYEKNRTD